MSEEQFVFEGVHHVALVSSDMARTVDFYTNVLGMPLIKTLELPGDGQHFFFDCGNGDCVAFFWYPNAPEVAPGVGSAAMTSPMHSAHGSMNHLAFNIAEDKFDAYVQRLTELGIENFVLNHDDSETQVAMEMHPGVFVRSVYFRDPDGILLEFACWTKTFDESDAQHAPANAAGERVTTTPA